MKKALEVLHIEDNKHDATLILHELSKYWPNIRHHRVQTAAELTEALKKEWDVVISDFTMPAFDGLTALRMVRDSGTDIPFILVSGRVEEDIAASMMRLGANDYVMKDNLKRLAPAITRELESLEGRKQAQAASNWMKGENSVDTRKSDTRQTKTHTETGNSRADNTSDSPANRNNTILERHKAVINILYAANIIRKHQAKVLQKHNLSDPQYHVLRILGRQHPTEVSISYVKTEVDNKTSDVSRILDGLCKASLVKYTENPEDKRIRNVSLTKEGLDKLAEVEMHSEDMFLPEAILSEEDAIQINQRLQKILPLMRK